MNEKILVVDDSNFNIKLLTEILEHEDFIIHSLNNGSRVLETTLEIKPDVIMLDIIMPGLDGFDVCKLLKSNTEVLDIPIIMVTSRTEGSDIKKALEMGAFDYIKKPLDATEVIARVQSAIRFKVALDKLKELAMKDSLTGIYNHALLIELFEKDLAKQERNSDNIAFVMIDIDFFKRVNDAYGHAAGDHVLKELSNILKDSIRYGDIVGRYGGEEFSIILEASNKQDTFNLCDRIRQKVEDYNFIFENETIKITISMGICFKEPKDITPGKEIIKKADEALYKAKNNGRNIVELY